MTHRSLKSYKIYPNGKIIENEREYISEKNLEVYINKKNCYSIVCTDGYLREMVMGRLYTEGMIRSADEVSVTFDETCSSAYVVTDNTGKQTTELQTEEQQAEEQQTEEPQNEECNTKNITEKNLKCSTLKGDVLREKIVTEAFRLAEVFNAHEGLHGITGSVHVCILSHKGSDHIFEDISRHNTIDKAVGYALVNSIPLSECVIFTSGRVPVDMTEKIIKAGIPVLISKSVPTAESVSLAENAGLTLIYRAWPDSCEM